MSSHEINLVIQGTHLSPAEIQMRKTLNRGIYLSLIITGILLIIILAVNAYFKNQIAQVDTQITSIQNRIKSLEQNEGKYMILKQKAAVITSILQNRYPYVDLLSFFKSLENSGGYINNVSLNESGQVVLQVTVDNTENLDKFLNTLTEAAQKRFTKIDLQGVGYKPNSSFNISLSIAAPKK